MDTYTIVLVYTTVAGIIGVIALYLIGKRIHEIEYLNELERRRVYYEKKD